MSLYMFVSFIYFFLLLSLTLESDANFNNKKNTYKFFN